LLEYRPELERAGKLVIAASLLGKEQDCINTTARDNDWIQYLLSMMTEGARSVAKFAAGNPVTFITYNYDRLIEYKMMNHLGAKWRAHDGALTDTLKRIRVIHLHGQLGTLTPGPRHVPFGALVDAPKLPGVEARIISRAARSIRILHQVKSRDPIFDAARGAMTQANVVFFLAFGFGVDNVRWLDFRNLRKAGSLWATRTRMTASEYTTYFLRPLRAADRYAISGGYTAPEDWDCLRLLREHVDDLV
jgi:hypothetical protein